MIVSGGGFLPASNRVPGGGMVLDEINTCITPKQLKIVKRFFCFNFASLKVILHIFIILIVLSCSPGNFFFPTYCISFELGK